MTAGTSLPPAQALELTELVAHAEQGIASRVVGKTEGGSVTLFAFDAGQELSEHTSPYDALVVVLEGTLAMTIAGTRLRASSGHVVRIPARASHALESLTRSKMMLVMLRVRETRTGTRSNSESPAPPKSADAA